MRSSNEFVVLLIFSIFGLVATTIFNSVIISQNKYLKFTLENKENKEKK
ncbi:hypothetical protein [Rossellomorea sp. BNER]|jgi:hypothetical protein|nr:hypothetical protein [Rossellomorea sp. BNER]